jgi:hypothetical protein
MQSSMFALHIMNERVIVVWVSCVELFGRIVDSGLDFGIDDDRKEEKKKEFS